VDYFEFRKSLEQSLGRLKLPSGSRIREPDWLVIRPPLSWTVEVVVDFPEKHVRIWESHDRFAGLQASRRIQWAYHYGETASFDEVGDSVRGKPDDPLDLRIDTAGGLHMHYGKRNPHYKQEEIEGLDLASVGAIDFIRTVLKHMKTGRPLNSLLGFRIKGS
jgi:hypothetical protein